MAITPLDWTTSYLDSLHEGKVVKLDEVKVRDKNLLIACIKQYIDWYGGIEFSSDYTSFRRIPKWNELVTD